MTIDAWIDVDLAREKETRHAPIVTIFGAGVTGLSLAHELVERGFGVQVVEARPDPDDEYSCEVGGLAANQVGRVPAEIERVHPYLFSEEDKAGEDAVDPDPRSIQIWVDHLGEEQVKVRVGDGEFEITTHPSSMEKTAERIRDGAIGAGFDAELHGSAAVLVTSKTPGEVARISVEVADPSNPIIRYEGLSTLAHLRASVMEPVHPRIPLPQRLQFERPMSDGDWREIEDEHCTKNSQKLDEIWAALLKAYQSYTADVASNIEKKTDKGGFDSDGLSERMRRREEFLLEIRGHTDGDGAPGKDRELSLEWADLVRQELVARNEAAGGPIPDLEKRILLVGVGGAERLGNPRRRIGRRRANRVELRIVEHHIPGEHGYRFFPGFYRHLFDTMKRTPILDAQGRETGRTAFDQLEAVEVVDVALEDQRRPHRVPVRGARSLEELRELMRMHLGGELLDLTVRDLLLFSLRMMQFLTSSAERRRGEYEEQSWWDFLVGKDENGNARYHYSAEMADLLRTTPEALVAMGADETDARTQGAVYAQLLTDVMRDGSEANRTLNGPTSEAWLGHWKRYLQRQGVRFFVGELSKLEWHGDELLPIVTRKTHDCGDASLQIILVDPGTLELELNGLRTSMALEAGVSLAEATKRLARQIDEDLDLGIAVQMSEADLRAGRMRLTPRHTEDDVLLRIRRPAIDLRIQLFGLEVPIGPDLSLLSAREPLEDVAVQVLRGSFLVSPRPGEALLWIRSRAAGRYGAEIDGRRVEIEVEEEEAPLSTEDIRDRLLVEIADRVRHLQPNRAGETGIRLASEAEGEIVHVDVKRWRGRVGRGVDLRVDREAFPQLDVLRGDSLRIVTDDPAVGIVGASPEIPDEVYVEIDPGGGDPSPSSAGGGPDFYVMALPFDEVSRLVWQAHEDGAALDSPQQLDGCFAQMMGFEKATARRTDAGVELPLVRDVLGRPTPARYPLRDLSGIQYYFSHQVRIGRGHTYYPRAPWGLSSISQVAYWRERMSRRSAFLGQLSVDIGRFYARAPDRDDGSPAPAWHTSKQGLAEEVWRQITAGLDGVLSGKLSRPAYYHLDQAIEFEGEVGERKLGPDGAVVGVADEGAADHALAIEGQTYAITLTSGEDASDVPRLLAAKIDAGPRPFLAAPLPVNTGDGPAHRLLVAAPAWGASAVIRVAGVAPVPYRIRIGSTPVIEMTPSGESEDEIRDAFVDGINDHVPGAIARAVEGARLHVDFASPDTMLSVLALDSLTHRLRIESGSSLRIRPVSATLSLENDEATPVRNATPFLINGPEVWKERPGLLSLLETTPVPMNLFWNPKSRIYYHLTRRRWLMAGNQMATLTRLSTMESANESARHAVASILHALLAPPTDPPTYNGQGTFFGDYPDFWDPEAHEFDDLAILRRLDGAVYDTKSGGVPLPHAFEILRLGEWVAGLPGDLMKDEFPGQISKLWGHVLGRLDEELGFTEGDEFVKTLRSLLDAFLKFDPS
jgi:hypothetical protein